MASRDRSENNPIFRQTNKVSRERILKGFFFEKSPTIARPYLYVVLGQILTRGKNYEALN